jgi:hypothetical protein
MANFRMCALYTTVEFSIQNNSTADARAHGHVNQARLVFASAPSGFAEGARVSIVFQRNRYVETPLQVFS